MATFVLVHGAWHGGWCYKRVARLLRGAGHEVYTPTLTGLGERAHLMDRSIDLDTHINDVVGVLRWEELKDVRPVRPFLWRHGDLGRRREGGRRASARSSSSTPSCRRTGKSLLDFLPAGNCRRACAPTRAQNGEGYKRHAAAGRIVSTSIAADAAWVNAMCVKQPIGTFEQGVQLTGARERVAKRTFIQAKGYETSPFGQFAEKLGGNPAWRVHSVPCGHDVMVDRPQELADALIAAA